jgi:hypothetical protein
LIWWRANVLRFTRAAFIDRDSIRSNLDFKIDPISLDA